jgi:heme A synthase
MTLAEALRRDLSPTGHLLIRLRLLHPVIAVSVGLWVGFVALRLLLGEAPGVRVRRYSRLTVGLVVLQLLAGAINVLLLAPVWMQIVHLFLADLVWISFVLLGASALAVPVAVDTLGAAEPQPGERLAPALEG